MGDLDFGKEKGNPGAYLTVSHNNKINTFFKKIFLDENVTYATIHRTIMNKMN